MQTRPFGSTGLKLPVLSVGTAAIGRPAYLTVGHRQDIRDPTVEGMRRLLFDVLDLAYAVGIRHVDTAFSYGLAETFVDEWMTERRFDDIFLTSKWGYSYVGQWSSDITPQEVKDLRLATFARQAPVSFRRFGSRLSGFQIHSATIASGVLNDPEVLDAMCALADAGVKVGISTSGPDQSAAIDAAIALRASGRAPFSFVQSTWNLFETSAGPALTRAAQAGLGVIVKEALANGLLVRGARTPSTVTAIADKHGVTPDAVCLAAAIALESRPVVLTGPSTLSHLRSNLNALDIRLQEDELTELTARPHEPSSYWEERSALPWT